MMALSAGASDRMIRAMNATGKMMMINWPLRWVPAHITAKRLIDEGTIGTVREVHGACWISVPGRMSLITSKNGRANSAHRSS
jgi:predicted dehydrogenase